MIAPLCVQALYVYYSYLSAKKIDAVNNVSVGVRVPTNHLKIMGGLEKYPKFHYFFLL